MRGAVLGVTMSLAVALCTTSCRTGPGNGRASADPSPSSTERSTGAAMVIESLHFEDGAPIPRRHAYRGEGDNVPPSLRWSKLPDRTRELALIVDDPDAPTPRPWVHDVLYAITPDASPLDEAAREAKTTGGLRKGRNSWGELGWGGPMPPPGKVHRYVFTLYALDSELALAEGQTKEGLLEAMEGHVLGTAKLVGTYQR